MKKRVIVMLAAILVFVMAVSAGCGSKETPESLAKSLVTVMEQKQSMESSMVMDVELSLSAGKLEGMNMEMSMNLNMDSKSMLGAIGSYNVMEMSISMLGMDQSISSEIYVTEEDGEIVSYTSVSTADGWTKVTGEDVESANTLAGYVGIFNRIKDGEIETQLQEETTTINNHECYVVTTNISSDVFADMTGSATEELFESFGGGIDSLGDAQVPCTFYIDKSEKVLHRVEMDVKALMNEIYGQMFASEDIDVTIDIAECSAVIDITSYDSVQPEDIAVPEEAKTDSSEISLDDLSRLTAYKDEDSWSEPKAFNI